LTEGGADFHDPDGAENIVRYPDKHPPIEEVLTAQTTIVYAIDNYRIIFKPATGDQIHEIVAQNMCQYQFPKSFNHWRYH